MFAISDVMLSFDSLIIVNFVIIASWINFVSKKVDSFVVFQQIQTKHFATPFWKDVKRCGVPNAKVKFGAKFRKLCFDIFNILFKYALLFVQLIKSISHFPCKFFFAHGTSTERAFSDRHKLLGFFRHRILPEVFLKPLHEFVMLFLPKNLSYFLGFFNCSFYLVRVHTVF